MTHIETNELTVNNKVKQMIGKPLTKKHVPGIGYVFYFDGGHAVVSGKGLNKQVVITHK